MLIVADRFLGTDRPAVLRAAAAAHDGEAAHDGARYESDEDAERHAVAGLVTPAQLRLVVRVPMPDAPDVDAQNAHRYFRRAHGAGQLFGRPGEHVARVAAAPIDGP